MVMVAEGSDGTPGGPVAWVKEGRRAAAWDLLEQLARQPAIKRVILVTPEPGPMAHLATEVVITPPGAIHFGRQVAALIDRFAIERLLYLGGGSAPLLDDTALTAIVEELDAAEPALITNNLFASDWAAVAPAAELGQWVERLPQDNMLGWVLSAEAGLRATARPATAANRLDIDTPTDLLTLGLHPGTKAHLSDFLAGLPLDYAPLRQAIGVLRSPATQVLVTGRFGPDVWQAVNRATRCWLRVLAEERGMVSSGRHLRGEVFSLFGDYLATMGSERFFDSLPRWADAAFIDSRVLLAHRGPWPSETDRFASDLGLSELVTDGWLRDFTAASRRCSSPVILGGHGLMAGDMLAICELL
jgi:hypothetical protein